MVEDNHDNEQIFTKKARREKEFWPEEIFKQRLLFLEKMIFVFCGIKRCYYALLLAIFIFNYSKRRNKVKCARYSTQHMHLYSFVH